MAPSPSKKWHPSSPEVEELRELFARQGPVPRSMAAKLQAVEENQRHAEMERKAQDERKLLLQKEAEARLITARKRRMDAKERKERSRHIQEEQRERNLELVRSVRAEEAIWQEQREARQADFEAQMRKRVIEASLLDARLDAEEEAAAEVNRQEGTRTRNQTLAAVEKVREANLNIKRAQAQSVKNKTKQAVARATRSAQGSRKAVAEQCKKEAEGWATERQRNQREHEARAQRSREGAMTTRSRAKAAVDGNLTARQMQVRKERLPIEATVAAAKAKLASEKKILVERRHAERYALDVSPNDWLNNPFARFVG